ncbi:MAG TPA: YebC/PmpR family DNA-binding transcriptional regulator [Candidatus Cloacimonadota bacterium]|jgi:YebC/PmpR family DNA-binding regulatory protein|nr:YebC/PmpR family DNA-binding transcriptional regulator [Candidatus Cloacimonadota bacterium]HOF59519.1 YebC/PmpR family DNA-binding transcriptional regulator [Candidatus Cloacimonadota bacterium]HOR58768.1 YebC/PmpR family DNA-binding transcriptional regulator [Candidatus Cloacimonadota bacterium]HPB08079.1 YebC/PmpR family DNA-binding transcriptional regulator [Candidatus Cloacimonadota bacterium]HQL13478.1 YebC/PmpR family DNA-binding transcriptional regulator [Candidatus Cloacimonadota ba
MSGHNKWSSIKHKKGAADAKRGQLFTRIVKEIILAAKNGGGDPEMNPRLRTAVLTAKAANMPRENIERAIKRGTGEIEGAAYEEITYEGYGHNGVGIVVDVMTDNKNRTVADLRHAFSKYGGNLAESGAVAWNFEQKGYFTVPAAGLDEDEFMMQALEAGAEDVELSDDFYEIYTAPTEFHTVLANMENMGFPVENAELTRVPKNTVNADDVAPKLFKLIEVLEELDDVQKVYSNFEVSDSIMAALSQE